MSAPSENLAVATGGPAAGCCHEPVVVAACRHGSACWRPFCCYAHSVCGERAARLRELAQWWAFMAAKAEAQGQRLCGDALAPGGEAPDTSGEGAPALQPVDTPGLQVVVQPLAGTSEGRVALSIACFGMQFFVKSLAGITLPLDAVASRSLSGNVKATALQGPPSGAGIGLTPTFGGGYFGTEDNVKAKISDVLVAGMADENLGGVNPTSGGEASGTVEGGSGARALPAEAHNGMSRPAEAPGNSNTWVAAEHNWLALAAEAWKNALLQLPDHERALFLAKGGGSCDPSEWDLGGGGRGTDGNPRNPITLGVEAPCTCGDATANARCGAARHRALATR